MSPIIFNLYGEYFTKEALAEVWEFKIGGRIINKVRFADDTAIRAKTQEELQNMVNRLVDTERKYGMEINIDKSQVMKVPRTEHWTREEIGWVLCIEKCFIWFRDMDTKKIGAKVFRER